MGKTFVMIALLTIFLISSVSAFEITNLEINGIPITDSESGNYIRQLSRDGDVDVQVELKSDATVDNVWVEVLIAALEHDAEEAYDRTSVFDMEEDVTYVKDLQIHLSERMENDKTYRLRVRVEDQSREGELKDYMLYVDSDTRMVKIKEVILSPENEIVSGHGLLVQPLLKNYGQRKETDVKIEAQIPELGVSGTAIMDDLLEDESRLSEPIFLKIPDCVGDGVYTLIAKATYDDGDESFTVNQPLRVVSSESCTPTATRSDGSEVNFVANYDATQGSRPIVRDDNDRTAVYKSILQYSLMGFAVLIIILVIAVIVRQARREAMRDEELLKELEEDNN